jgi:ferredoxin
VKDDGRFPVVFETPQGEAGVDVAPEEYILESGRRAGLDLPSMCEQGWCTTCAVRVLEGEIDQSDSRRFYPEDREAGFGLICTGKPRSALRLRTHQHNAMRDHRREQGLPAPQGGG